MKHEICDVDALEGTVGGQPLAALMKSIAALDAHCSAVLGYSTAAVMMHRDREGVIHAGVMGGAAGFARPDGGDHLVFDAGTAQPEAGSAAALLFLVPGWRESLRVNGRIDDTGLVVEEAFVHCGKAMIRSHLWSPPVAATENGEHVAGESDRIDDAQRAFLSSAPFAVVGSCDGAGGADASPKGDPAGFLRVLDDHTVAVPDRPGNRRTDTFHNLLDRPAVTVLAMSPGDDRVLELRGQARMTTDPQLLTSMAVKDQVPKLALVVDVEHCSLRVSDAVQRAALWDDTTHLPDGVLPRAAKIWADHVKSSDRSGLAATAVRTGVSEAAVRAGIAVDYRKNLY
ncbi:PPOX class probable FMN-dependent enzyme, DR_2398 family [Aeromicrobium marinum DSM 15272]|uniref:PPOX class probable FMN-dependent enzyme, DR_2398 family n=1 Tax=Aeromicrobium marinum DSM 15272 TaxID=585531 RepID=E2SFN7_9ACTN|nr:pyridoxamine 5'-phosphate oxidase family protein [Aeromicrobium marinum]EFQ82004.1 PPOX class probable FMN-dependent enzyme, DR_2398 family [Aeromicrobium marinum DSM 15272]